MEGVFNVTDNLKIFARRLKELRNEKGITQEDLARRIGCPPSLISYYETMQREPGFSNILALSRVLGESPDYLMGVTEYRDVKKIAE
jgi:transcriptional regulator with XRE-family HTH domain